MRKFDICYLHIGTGKTGSTSIQDTLFGNRPLLEELGYCYPGPTHNHFRIALGLSERPKVIREYFHKDYTPEEVRADALAHMGRIEADLGQTSAAGLVLSSERFYVLRPPLFGDLLDYVRGFAREVKVVCYVRHPAAFAVSGLQQEVRAGFSTLASFDPERAIDRTSARLGRIAEAVGRENLVVRPFDRSQLVGGDVVRDFLQVIGVDEAAHDRFEFVRINESLSQEAVLLSDALNAREPLSRDGVRNPRRAAAPDAAFRRIRGAAFALSPEQMAQLVAAAEPECERLRDRFGLSFAAPRPPAGATLWGNETIADIAVVINDLMRGNERLRERVERLRSKTRSRGGKAPRILGVFRAFRRRRGG